MNRDRPYDWRRHPSSTGSCVEKRDTRSGSRRIPQKATGRRGYPCGPFAHRVRSELDSRSNPTSRCLPKMYYSAAFNAFAKSRSACVTAFSLCVVTSTVSSFARLSSRRSE